MAGRDRRGTPNAGRRQDREEAAGPAVPRPRIELLAARRRLYPGHALRHHAAEPGQGALVSGAQEGRRHPRRPAGRRHRPEFQRRVRRRLFRALHDHCRRHEPRADQDAVRRHPPAPAAGAKRQQGRPHRRAARAHFHRVQPRQARHHRRYAATDLRQRYAAKCGGLRRIGRNVVRPRPSPGDRRLLRRRCDRGRTRAGRRTRLPPRRHRNGHSAATKTRRSSCCAKAASRRSASASRCRTAPTS